MNTLELSPASTQEPRSAEGFSTTRQGRHSAPLPPGDTSAPLHAWHVPFTTPYPLAQTGAAESSEFQRAW